MHLDVILPTFNRAPLLPRAIGAFLAARVPAGVQARLLVVDNNSTDATRATVAAYVERHPARVGYLFEPKQGRHHALNAGIVASDADVLGFVDDDEVMDASWIEVVARELGKPGLDFIGGPYRANWLAPQPAWLPPGFTGPAGISDQGPDRLRYGAPGFTAHVMGGNGAFRRGVFDRVGLYSNVYYYAEDLDMFRRVIEAGFIGDYVPDMEIIHDIPPHRLRHPYFRHWAYTAGRNDGKFDRAGRYMPGVPRLFGLPRWRWRRAGEDLLAWFWYALSGRPTERFAAELRMIDFAGFLRGRWIRATERQRDRSGGATRRNKD